LLKALKLELEDFSLGLEASIENIRIGLKFELNTNALAYFSVGSIERKDILQCWLLNKKGEKLETERLRDIFQWKKTVKERSNVTKLIDV
jgi:hypothetical protein